MVLPVGVTARSSLTALVVFFAATTVHAANDGGTEADVSAEITTRSTGGAPADGREGLDFTGTPVPPPSPWSAELASPSAGPGRKRVLPDYDGRAPTPGTPGETFVWGPRAILFPAHLVAEYALRRPLVDVITFGDEHYLWQRVYHFFTWDDGRDGVYPILDLEEGLKSTAGAAFFARESETSRNSLHASAAFADQGVINLRVRDHVDLWAPGRGGAYVHATWVRRPDGMYFGPGGLSRQSDLLYYFYDDRAAELGVDGKLGAMSAVSVELGAREIGFSTDTRSSDRPSVGTRFGGVAEPPLPAGFAGYGLFRPRVVLVLDSRDPVYEHPTGSGVRLETNAAYSRCFSDAVFAFVSWGAALAGFWDISGVNHVVALEVATRFVEPISGAVPFTELPALGGEEMLGGFFNGRFRDQSVFAATVQYRSRSGSTSTARSSLAWATPTPGTSEASISRRCT